MTARPLLGVACALAGGVLIIASGAEAVRGSTPGGSNVTLPVVVLAGLAIAALGAAAELFGWVRPPQDEPDTPTNALIHGAARPASEAEALAAASGVATSKPAHGETYPD
jgi:hypothetical protein